MQETIYTLINAKKGDKRPSVWLVWTVSLTNLQTLEGIATRPEMAIMYKDAIEHWREEEHARYKDIVLVWVEPVWTDHLICMPLVTAEELQRIAQQWATGRR